MKSELHQKKNRQRNLVPAKTGILILIMAFIMTIIHYAAYGLTSSLTLHNLDAYTRSYYLGFMNDLYPCFISPMIVLFEAPVITRKIKKSFSNSMNNMYEKFELKNNLN